MNAPSHLKFSDKTFSLDAVSLLLRIENKFLGVIQALIKYAFEAFAFALVTCFFNSVHYFLECQPFFATGQCFSHVAFERLGIFRSTAANGFLRRRCASSRATASATSFALAFQDSNLLSHAIHYTNRKYNQQRDVGATNRRAMPSDAI